MECRSCGGLVIWKGPLTALTHTECESCGAINNQVMRATDEELLQDKQGRLDDASNHPYECTCEICQEWWQELGPEQ